ncbi:MAG: hypothetical protein JNK14_19915 [Chitinophagaceae bacterium]|nr:hypothetical protein [Chitinophagaceae bacterium]
MSRKKIIWLIIFLAAAGGTWYGYREYNRTQQDYKNVNPDHTLSAAALIQEYEKNDSVASKKYNGKSVEINGSIRSIEKDEKGFYTVVVGEAAGLSSVRCSMDTSHAADAAVLAAGTSVNIRGACAGFNKDEMGIGSDVIMNYCVIITKKE